MRLSYFASERDSTPRAIDVSWEQIAQQLSAPKRGPCTLADCAGKKCPHKLGASWSPAVYPAGATRGMRNVDCVSVFALDVDHATEESLSTIALRLQGFTYIAHATHTDGKDGERAIRLVIPLTRPVSRADWPRFWDAAVALLGIPADRATRDCSRLFFLPSRPSDADYLFATNEGAALDTDVVLEQAAAPDPADDPVARNENSDFPPASPALLARALERLTQHGPAIEGQGGDQHTYRACAIVCHDFALDDDEAWFVLSAWDRQNKPPWGESLRTKIRNATSYAQGEKGAARQAFEADRVMQDWIGTLSPSANNGQSAQADNELPALVSDVAKRTKPPVRTYATGIVELDTLLGGGSHTRQLLTVCGPPSGGKSSFVVSVTRSIATTIPALYCSTELESDELAARFAAPILGVSWTSIVKNEKSEAMLALIGQKTLAEKVQEALEGQRIHVIGCEALPRDGDQALNVIYRAGLAVSNFYGIPPLIVVDYLQDLARGAGGADAKSATGDIATKLRIMSQLLDCPIMPVSSVSRTYYGQAKQETMRMSDDATIYLSAAKESGDVDYASAAILFLDVEQDEGKESRPARIAVARARMGRSGFAGARFFGAAGRWEGDPSALEALSPEVRRKKVNEKKTSEREDRIIGIIKDEGPCSANKIYKAIGGTKEDVLELIRLMVRTGKLIRIGELHGLPDVQPALSLVPPVTEAPASILDGFIRGGLHS